MKVLVVDDQDVNRQLPAAILRKVGVDVIQAASGPEALARMQEQPDIRHLLLDVSMPGMSGTEVCRTLRQGTGGEGLLIVAYTAHAFPEEKAQIMEAGFDELLIKPISRSSLLQALGLD
ncbi:MAG: response regulator [Betaproteobacteria bacterium]|nr:response regulator [Betaproteobacteria bacterium]